MTSYYDGVAFLAICGKAESPEPLQFAPAAASTPRVPRTTRLNEFAPYPTFRHTPPSGLQRPNQHPYLTHQPAHYTPHGIAASGPGPGGPAPGPGGGPPPAPPQQQTQQAVQQAVQQQQQQHQQPVMAVVSPVSSQLGGLPGGTPPMTSAMSPVPRQQLPRAPQQQAGTPGGAGFSAEVAVAVGARATPSPNMRQLSMTPRRDSLPGNTSSGSATPRHSNAGLQHKSGRISTAMHPDPKQQYKTEECNICGRPFKGPKASTHKQQHIRRLHPESYMPKRGGKKKVDNRETSVESMPPSQSQSPQQSGGGFYQGDLANVANAAMFPQ